MKLIEIIYLIIAIFGSVGIVYSLSRIAAALEEIARKYKD